VPAPQPSFWSVYTVQPDADLPPVNENGKRVPIANLDHAAGEVGERSVGHDGENGKEQNCPHSPPLGLFAQLTGTGCARKKATLLVVSWQRQMSKTARRRFLTLADWLIQGRSSIGSTELLGEPWGKRTSNGIRRLR
jgi:hypothetical protein